MTTPNIPGNPYAGHRLQLSHDTSALHSALLAVAFELRTANLIAEINGERSLPRPVWERLGRTFDG